MKNSREEDEDYPNFFWARSINTIIVWSIFQGFVWDFLWEHYFATRPFAKIIYYLSTVLLNMKLNVHSIMFCAIFFVFIFLKNNCGATRIPAGSANRKKTDNTPKTSKTQEHKTKDNVRTLL
uniref:Uncharacterized protein n=1 Tax=Cacopsylla melanoneura TaxID=428564 RepID=A0A8D8YWX0_9HEMI